MQKMMLNSCQVSPLRFFIIDDSGSMSCGDGKQILGLGHAKKYELNKKLYESVTQMCMCLKL